MFSLPLLPGSFVLGWGTNEKTEAFNFCYYFTLPCYIGVEINSLLTTVACSDDRWQSFFSLNEGRIIMLCNTAIL